MTRLALLALVLAAQGASAADWSIVSTTGR